MANNSDENKCVPLIFPKDFDTPPDLDKRILKEMADLKKALDKADRKKEKNEPLVSSNGSRR